ncbi:hypothetical protein CSHISOI_05008 [Colletotrichum shisoi]|uniref:Uncharacterized protein n=1 Tax=Colletotrichum shisoi TaxID=2078593 RepID=A0A5Q4BTU2_9PEZI|nr:hypothetical protein CSHISOI_05008 [Colletotrichum shisoi]
MATYLITQAAGQQSRWVVSYLLAAGANYGPTFGMYAAAALQDPETFGGQEIDLGNELLAIEEVRDILVRVGGREVGVVKRAEQEAEELGISGFGLKFHLMSNVKDLSWTTTVAKGAQEKFGIPFTSLEAALRSSGGTARCSWSVFRPTRLSKVCDN